jgi:hypothetical protein
LVEFNSEGFLEPGLHSYTYIDFKEQFLESFTTSYTRGKIFPKMFLWLSEINKILEPAEIWCDGSYTTLKNDPNDIDIVIFFDKIKLDENKYKSFEKLRSISKSYLCDAYLGIINNINATGQDINNRNYWRGQFGFDRNDRPKGIVVLDWKEIKIGLKEVGLDV